MSELTDNQQKVLTAIQNGADANDTIADQSGLAKSSVTAVVNSLVKRELVSKSEDGKYSASNNEKEEAEEKPKENLSELNSTSTADESQAIDPASSDADEQAAITVLIPYLKSEAAGDELKYALRTWADNFKEDIRVVVIGDQEDWFSPEIVHIPHEPHLIKEVCNCPAPSMIRNPQADVTHKIFTAIAAGVITDNFILTNDDIFLVGQTYPSDVEFLKSFGRLVDSGKKGGLYNQNAIRTAKALKKNNLPDYRFGTHTPMKLNVESLLAVIEKYDALENGYLLSSLYFNDVYPLARPVHVDGTINDRILASVYRPDVSVEVLDQIFRSRKFVNCDSKGWQAVKPFLKKFFPNPSRFEK